MEYLHGLLFIRRGVYPRISPLARGVCGLLEYSYECCLKKINEEVKSVRDLSRQQVFKGGMERGRRFIFAIH